MRPRNLGMSEAVLEHMLQQYERKPYDLDVFSRRFRSECDCDLESQVDTPIARGKCGDDVVYLTRWKLYWNLASDINDLGWVRASYTMQNRCFKRRCSVRAGRTASERVAKIVYSYINN